jgi:hypothetical protein
MFYSFIGGRMANMNLKQLLRMVCLSVLVILSILLAAQDKSRVQKKGVSDKNTTQTVKATDSTVKKDAQQPGQPAPKEEKEKDFDYDVWIKIGVLLIAAASFLFSIYKYVKGK